MSEQAKELLELPREFVKEGTQFLNRCTKPDQREFVKYARAFYLTLPYRGDQYAGGDGR